ncbi:MAG TPA: SDR family NAD(P)-dependent oxidoreductase [Myxococcales bacterium]|nr:SDR family NAD(P)-dependent oxidoreductase [Myxococcales bacterium]
MVNNAGLSYPASILDGDPEERRSMLETNILAVLVGCQAAVKAMRACRAEGQIVNVSLVAAHLLGRRTTQQLGRRWNLRFSNRIQIPAPPTVIDCLRQPQGIGLFVTKRCDGVEVGRFPRRVKSKENPDAAGKEDGTQDGDWRENEGDLGEMRNHLGSRETQGDSDNPANHAKDHRFHEELNKDVPPLGAHRHPNADFPGPLGYGDQQDVHDSDPAHQK